MASGNPPPNYYASEPLVGAYFKVNKSIWHGQDVSPNKKYLRKLVMMTPTANAVPSKWILCDYLMYYPVIDTDVLDPQVFDTTTDTPLSLPRYTSGEGVMAMLVASTPYASTGVGTFTISYVNSKGNPATSMLCNTNSATYIASIMNSGGIVSGCGGPWIPLASGDTGIRAVNSITFTSASGGLGTLVLVKPLYDILLREVTAPVEIEAWTQRAGLGAQIMDGAYLSFIGWANASISGATFNGYAEFVWG